MSTVKISVIIPTCHRNDLLAKCLDCLAPGVQTLPPDQYEVVVTDDGSKSTAEEMVSERYPWVRWEAGPRRGSAANRNHGSQIASGMWLGFVDDDCVPSPEWLSALLSATCYGYFYYEGRTTCDEGIVSPMMEAPVNQSGGLFNSCNILVDRQAFINIGGFDENLPYPAMEDWELHGRIKRANLKVIFVSDAVVNHPPRRRYWGKHYAKMLESHTYVWCKERHTKPFWLFALTHMQVGRFRTIFKYPLSYDTIIALCSLIVEAMYVASYVGSWERKYRQHFSNAHPTPHPF